MKKIKVNIQDNTHFSDANWEKGFDTVSDIADAIKDERFTDDSSISGNLSMPMCPPSKKKIVEDNTDVNITVNENYVQFEDKEVLRVLKDNGIGDGTGITKEQAAAYTGRMDEWFKGMTITSFEELKYFGSANLRATFQEATIGKIDFKNVETLDNYVMRNATILTNYIFFSKLKKLGVYTFMGATFANTKEPALFFAQRELQIPDNTLRGNKAYLIDFNSISLCKSLNDSDAVRIYVVRDNNVNHIPFHTNNRYIFVPASIVSEYRNSDEYATVSDKIFAIGGPEWVTEFGSADPYADVMKYAPDDYDEIVEAYDSA